MEEQKYMVSVRSYDDAVTKGNLTSIKTKVREVSAEKLSENLSALVNNISQSLSSMEENISGSYYLDEFEINAEITLSGTINIIGGLSSGATGGVTLKFKKK